MNILILHIKYLLIRVKQGSINSEIISEVMDWMMTATASSMILEDGILQIG